MNTKPMHFIAAFVLLSTEAAASLVDPVNRTRHGISLKGYDPVGYFKESRPVKGSEKFSFQWMGATWWFASSENRDLFQNAPEKYAPRFGGYCAWAVSKGYTADIDPEAWKIVDGKLYLNYNKDIQKKWEADLPQRIAAAEKNWPSLHK